MEALVPVVASEPSGALMIPVVCADGETRSYASHIVPIRDPHGELLASCAAWSPPPWRDASKHARAPDRPDH